ncbi:MAG TPA: methyltransferase [Acidobacteriaceae bacterium]|jgi:protein-S-isoprenylcysteine O-methyltransferase Ste14|nr:methyltransferase [Acidobacteriaceae bacterium]
MSLLIRTIVYATFFIGFLLVWLPARVLAAVGIDRPAAIGVPQVAGLILGILGAVLALSCVAAFIWLGKGTPAPFDAPRRLVVRGPYRFIRNPMYLGAGLALAAAALFYRSAALLAYAALFLLAFHCFVLFYEEPTLRRIFGVDYENYCRRTGRWWPHLRVVSR